MIKTLLALISLTLLVFAGQQPALAASKASIASHTQQRVCDHNDSCCDHTGNTTANQCRSCCTMRLEAWSFANVKIVPADPFFSLRVTRLVSPNATPEPPPPRIFV
jgi:hypothetical protein